MCTRNTIGDCRSDCGQLRVLSRRMTYYGCGFLTASMKNCSVIQKKRGVPPGRFLPGMSVLSLPKREVQQGRTSAQGWLRLVPWIGGTPP